MRSANGGIGSTSTPQNGLDRVRWGCRVCSFRCHRFRTRRGTKRRHQVRSIRHCERRHRFRTGRGTKRRHQMRSIRDRKRGSGGWSDRHGR